jgi:hypothetical protein
MSCRVAAAAATAPRTSDSSPLGRLGNSTPSAVRAAPCHLGERSAPHTLPASSRADTSTAALRTMKPVTPIEPGCMPLISTPACARSPHAVPRRLAPTHPTRTHPSLSFHFVIVFAGRCFFVLLSSLTPP